MQAYRQAATYHQALSSPTRLALLDELLDTGSCTCICELAKRLGKDQSTVYRHAKQLEAAGLIHTRKDKRKLHCCLKDKEHTKTILMNPLQNIKDKIDEKLQEDDDYCPHCGSQEAHKPEHEECDDKEGAHEDTGCECDKECDCN